MKKTQYTYAGWTGTGYATRSRRGVRWISDYVGNIWTYENGNPVNSNEFCKTTIILCGGPYNGTRIS